MVGQRVGEFGHAAEDHDHHERAFDELGALARAVERARPEARTMALRRLYQRLALIVSDDLAHMHEEETRLMPLLMAHFTAAERREIEHRIVSAIAPEKMVLSLRCRSPSGRRCSTGCRPGPSTG